MVMVLAPSIPHFNCLGLNNLKYVLKLNLKKRHNKVTNHNYIFFCGSNFYEVSKEI